MIIREELEPVIVEANAALRAWLEGDATTRLERLRSLARSSCHLCNGRGVVLYTTGRADVCSCVQHGKRRWLRDWLAARAVAKEVES